MFALFAGLPHTRAATTERIVVDRHAGLAIGGYDPVAFFTDGRPKAGNPELELRYGGAIWRFCNVATGRRLRRSPRSTCRSSALTIPSVWRAVWR